MNTCRPRRTHPHKSPGDCPPDRKSFHSLDEIVQDYIDTRRPRAKEEMEYFGDHRRTLREAIHIAALAINEEGKRHDHQHRIPRALLEYFEAGLLRKSAALRASKTFSELMAISVRIAAGIWKHPGLTAYDTTHRIGAYLGVRPDRVYLHTGAREGAKTLGFKGTLPFIFRRELPKPFRKLKPYEIENCLCIYKESLKKLPPRRLNMG